MLRASLALLFLHDIQKKRTRAHVTRMGPWYPASIHLLRTAIPWRFWTNCVEFLAEAVEPRSDEVGGACTLHLPALTVPHFSTSQHL